MSAASRGAAAEREARDILAGYGYFVLRAPGSKGPGAVDLVAIRPGVVLMVQVKSGTAGLRPPEWNQLLAIALTYGAVPVLAERRLRKPMTWWRLDGPKREGHSTNVQPRTVYDPAGGAAAWVTAPELERLAEVSGVNPVPDRVAAYNARVREAFGLSQAAE